MDVVCENFGLMWLQIQFLPVIQLYVTQAKVLMIFESQLKSHFEALLKIKYGAKQNLD